MSAERSPKAAGGLPEKIGRYRILGRLGKGAMGVVYSARDDLMDRKVAVKVMMGDLEADPETRARFYREAKVAGQLLHRNIVTVFELGEEEERLYMVMELLKGETLPEFLSRSDPVPLEVKVDLMMQVCEGLVVAHSRGIFHRDIKPRNLFVQKDGSLKILDFGIARIASSTMTRAGFIVGTPDYMSPEQARGQEIDQRSDIFSTAGVFYLALTGRKPFGAPDLPAILNKVQQEDPPALTEHEAPPELARIVFRALAKQLERRYQHMVEMLADLKRFRAQYDLETRHLCDQVRRRLATVESLLAERAEIASTLALPPGAVAEEDEAAVAFAGWQSRFSADALALVRLRRVELVPLATEVQARDEELTAAIAPLRAARQAFEAGRGLLESDPRAAIVHFEQTLRCLASSAAAAEAVVRCGDLISRRQAVEDEARGLFERARAAAASDLDTAIGICTQALSLGVILPEVAGLKSELESRREHLRQERAATLERRIEAAHRALDLGDLDGADRDVLGALEMDPDDPAAQDLRQRIERARTDAAIATERARREAEEIELACAAFAAGSREEALGRLKAFVDHEPEAVAAAARLRRLEEETRRLEELERRLAQAAA
ncbi:MAG: protein kinase, partial [Acidobacteria bacterium]|nr:protein kinase [Acidobacteriota bacterium]